MIAHPDNEDPKLPEIPLYLIPLGLLFIAALLFGLKELIKLIQ